MTPYEQGFTRTMKCAGFEINMSHDNPYEMGIAAKHDDTSYFGPVVVQGVGGAGMSGAMLGGGYQAMTGESVPGTLKSLIQEGGDATWDKVRRGHADAVGPAVDALRRGAPFGEALGNIDGKKYLRRLGKGGLLGAGLGMGLKALSNAGAYGTGYTLSDDPGFMDYLSGIFS